jgi:hypothetical protein
MGNGATDLSSNITAIRNGDVLLSAGALTGELYDIVLELPYVRACDKPLRRHSSHPSPS